MYTNISLKNLEEELLEFMDEQVEYNGFASRADYLNYVLKMVKLQKITFARTVQMGVTATKGRSKHKRKCKN